MDADGTITAELDPSLEASCARILIVAYGNPLRCDDRLAWCAAEELSTADLPADVEIITSHQLTPELAQSSESSILCFIPRCCTERGAGRIGICTAVAGAPIVGVYARVFAWGHPDSSRKTCTAAVRRPSRISLCGECFDHGEMLSPTVEEALPGSGGAGQRADQQGRA